MVTKLKFVMLLTVLLAASLMPAQIAILPGANGHATCKGGNGCTTPAVDSTGATLIIFGLVGVPHAPTATPAACATWTPLTPRWGNICDIIYYCYAPTTNSSQTFSCTGNYASCFVALFSGTDTTSAVFVAENGATTGPGHSLATGAVNPAGTGNLIFSFIGGNGNNTPGIAIDSGLSILDKSVYTGSNFGGSDAYLVDSNASSINPTWSWTNLVDGSTAIAVFKPAAATKTCTLALMGAGPC